MSTRTWIITGVSSGFGYELTKQILAKGDTVVGTVLKGSVPEFEEQYPDTFIPFVLDVTNVEDVYRVVNEAAQKVGRIDVAISNAGYGLFGAAEEFTSAQVKKIIDTNLVGSIEFIRAVLPIMRKQGGGRIIQISSYGGQVAYPGNSMYHATKWGIEGYCESLSKEVDVFNIGVTIVEPGGARTEFRYSSAQTATFMPEYEGNAAHAFMDMLDPEKGLAPGDPARMATRIIESVDLPKAPMRMVLGSAALQGTIDTLEARLADFKTQTELAASTDFPEGE